MRVLLGCLALAGSVPFATLHAQSQQKRFASLGVADPNAGFELDSARRTLPPGFLTSQISAGARTGGIGAAIGAAAGIGVIYLSVQDRAADGMAIFLPLTTALLGYSIAAPIGVYRYSKAHGVSAPASAAAIGGVVGITGFLLGGIPVIVTVPLGAALGHNAARK